MMRRFPLVVTAALSLWAGMTAAQPCDALAERAGAEQGVPPGLMAAIARTESGRADGSGGVSGWAWTLNQGGKGSFHPSRAEAQARLDQLLAQGVRNVDVGCMQVNYRWHHGGFADVSQMLDPALNTRYAARFLRGLHDRLGSWEAATAAYHSLDAVRGRAYLARVTALRDGGPAPAPAPAVPPGLPAGSDTEYAAVAARVAGLLALPAAPLVGGLSRPAPQPATRPAPPPLVLAEDTVPALERAAAPPRLQRQWADLAAMRRTLAATRP